MKLFGTDGIRAIAGQYPLDSATVELLGRILCFLMREKKIPADVIIGQDTRESGDGGHVAFEVRNHPGLGVFQAPCSRLAGW